MNKYYDSITDKWHVIWPFDLSHLTPIGELKISKYTPPLLRSGWGLQSMAAEWGNGMEKELWLVYKLKKKNFQIKKIKKCKENKS